MHLGFYESLCFVLVLKVYYPHKVLKLEICPVIIENFMEDNSRYKIISQMQ